MNMLLRHLNLIMAGFWLFVGGSIILWHWQNPDEQSFRLIGTQRLPPGWEWARNLSAGWVGIVLALFNLIRWWSVRSRRPQRLPDPFAGRRERREPRREPIADREPDPNFKFTDE